MIARSESPRILQGCNVLPPMDGQSAPAQTPPTQSSPRNGSRSKRPAGGRFELLNSFIDFTAGKLLRSDILVWLILYRDCHVGVARTSQADIARRARIGTRTVRNAINRLRNHGLLEVVHQGGLNRGTSTYRPRGLAVEHQSQETSPINN